MSGNMSRYDTEGFLLNVRSISRQEGSPILQKNLPRGSSSGSDGRSQTQEIDGAQPPRYSSLANTKDHSIENYELKKSEMFLHNLYDDPAPIPPCTSPIPSTRSDTSNSITPPSRQPIRLDLALEDNFEEDEELPTTRLLDGLGVNVVNGIPQVMISSDLKTLLKKKMESNSGEENGNQNNHLRDSWMEPSNSHTTPRHHTSIASESGQIRMSHVSDDVVVQDINEESTTLNSFRIRSIKEAAKSSIAEVERARADLETELKSILRSTGPKSTSQSERVTFQDQKDQTYKEPALEIPLVNRAAYEDLIDNDIEERVRQLQLENDRIGALQSCEEVRELGFDEDLIRSKQLLNQLENDIENTVFEVPDFGRNSPPVEPQLQCLDNEKPDDQFCKLPSRNYNVERQAKSLGLKRRDLSHIFINSESKQNRMKNYRPTATKPNTKKATSRIDSGKKTANHSVRSVAQRMPGFDSKQSGLNVYNVLNGEKTTPNANSYQQELMYQNYKSSLNSQRRKPEKVNKTINKTITTLQLGDDGISEVKEKSSLSNKVPYERTRIDYPQRNRTPTKSPLLTSTHEQNDTKISASLSNRKPRPQSCKPSPDKQRITSNPQTKPQNSGLHEHKSVKNRPTSAPIFTIKTRPASNSTSNNKPANVTAETTLNTKQKAAVRSAPAARPYMGDVTTMMTEPENDKTTFIINKPNNQKSSKARPVSAKFQPNSKTSLTPERPRRVGSAPVNRQVITHNEQAAYNKPIQIDEKYLSEITKLQEKTSSYGVEIDKTTLTRALLPPAPQESSTCKQQFSKNFFSSGLLSKPQTWMKKST